MEENNTVRRFVDSVRAELEGLTGLNVSSERRARLKNLLQRTSGTNLSEIVSAIRKGYFLRVKRAKSTQAGQHVTHTEEAAQFFEAMSQLAANLPRGATDDKELSCLLALVHVVRAYLDSILLKSSPTTVTSRPVLSHVTSIVKALHDALPYFDLSLNTGYDEDSSVDSNPNVQTPLRSFSVANASIDFRNNDSIKNCTTKWRSTILEIMDLCEFYWISNFVDRHLVVQFLILSLFRKSMEASATKANLKRIWTLRDLLRDIDFVKIQSIEMNYSSVDIIPLVELLPRAVSNPLYCKTVEGRKIIAFAFTLHKSIASKIHEAIKAQILYVHHTAKEALQSYGDIYLQAWKISQNEDDLVADDLVHPKTYLRSFIEEEILSDLVSASLHVASPSLAKKLRIMLEPFLVTKKDALINGLLYRLYGPVLWRSLSVANPIVRYHALSSLALTFPLQDPSLSSKESIRNNRQDVVNKSIRSLQQLLIDPHPKVRIAAADSTVRILAPYWDAIPPKHIRSLLQIIITQHANDSSSSNVRANAVHVITLLLKATDASHAVLKMLLPSLGNLIHDKIENVRLKTVRLLSVVKIQKDIKFYHVVPSEHLLSRLAVDGMKTTSVSRALTKLLLHSYFPPGAKGSEQVERTLLFLSKSPNAAFVFFTHLKHFYPVNVICKLIAMLLKVLKLAVDRHKTALSTLTDDYTTTLIDYGVENVSAFDLDHSANGPSYDVSSLSATNTTLMASVAETIQMLHESIDSLPIPCEEYLKSFASNEVDLYELALHFEQMAIQYRNLDRSRTKKCSSHEGPDLYPPRKQRSLQNRTTEFQNIDGNDLRQNKIKITDCERISAAILKFSRSIMCEEQVACITSNILSRISSLNPCTNESIDEESLCLQICLLYSYGKYLDISRLLSDSIVDGIKTFERSFFSNVQGGVKNKYIIPLDMALNILNNILKGQDRNLIAVREKLLTLQDCRNILSNAFSLLHEERFMKSLKTLKVQDYPTILKLNELNLRYRMHVSFAVDDCQFHFIDELSRIHQFLSDRIFPLVMTVPQPRDDYIMRRPSSPFQILNVSNISVSTDASSRLSLSPVSLCIKPLKRKRTVYQHDTSDQLKGCAYVLSYTNLCLITLLEYIVVGGEPDHDIICQFKSYLESISLINTEDRLVSMAKRSLGSTIDRFASLGYHLVPIIA